jgi:hypothetical protein
MLAGCLLKVIEIERCQLAWRNQILRPAICSSRPFPATGRLFESVDRHFNVVSIGGIRISYDQDVAVPVKRLSDRRIAGDDRHASV